MRFATLVITVALALGAASAADASPRAAMLSSLRVASQPQDVPSALSAQGQDPSPSIDVNVDIREDGVRGAWYASPAWIAIFILDGLLLLVLVAMAARGGGALQGTTIVK